MIKNIILITMLFFLLYFPPLISIDTLHILGAFSILCCLLFHKQIFKYINIKKLIILYFYFVGLMVYILLIIAVNSNEVSNIATYLFYIIDIFPVFIIIIFIMQKNRIQLDRFITLLLLAGNIQGIFALIGVIYPQFRLWYATRLVSLGYGDVYIGLSGHRIYGLAGLLNYATPIFQAVLFCLAIYMAINKRGSYILYAPLLILSAILNARTTLVIIVIGLVLMVLHSIKKINVKKLIRSIVVTSLIIIVSINLMNLLAEKVQATYVWIEKGILEISHFIRGDTVGYFNYLTDINKWRLPNDWELYFGTGTYIMTFNMNGVTSDIGWINDIWYGGILYSILIYIPFLIIYFVTRVKLKNSSMLKFILDLLVATIIIMNFKGIAFSKNEVMITFLLLICIIYLPFKDNKYIKDSIT